MAVVFAKPEIVEQLLAVTDELEIAAYNSAGSVTVSGSVASLEQLTEEAARAGVKVHRLDLDYPFHCQSMDVVRQPLIEDLASLSPHAGRCEFVSTVEGKTISGLQLGADYWWRNVREPVQFLAGVQEAARRGARVFVEIGPRKTLLGHVGDNLESAAGTIRADGRARPRRRRNRSVPPRGRNRVCARRADGDGCHRRQRSGRRHPAPELSVAAQAFPPRRHERSDGRAVTQDVAPAHRFAAHL